MAIIKDTVRPELQRIKTELSALGKLTIHVGIQGTAGSDILTIAGVHEYGATIRAKNVKNLAIPLDKKSEGKSPRDFPGLFFIRAKDTGNLFGVTSAGKEKLNFLFLLRYNPGAQFHPGPLRHRPERARGRLPGSG